MLHSTVVIFICIVIIFTLNITHYLQLVYTHLFNLFSSIVKQAFFGLRESRSIRSWN